MFQTKRQQNDFYKTIIVLYTDNNGDVIEDLSFQAESLHGRIDISFDFAIPRIGETIINRSTVFPAEYLVKDIVRAVRGTEYLIQIMVTKQDKPRFKF